MVEDVKAAVEVDAGDLARPLQLDDLDAVTVLALAGAALSERATELLEQAGFAGLRPSHARLIGALLGGPRTVSELAAALSVSSQAVSKVVGALAALDYVSVRAGDDARVRLVDLAPRGRRAVLAARAARQAVAVQHGRRLDHVRSELLTLLAEVGVLEDVLERRVFPD